MWRKILCLISWNTSSPFTPGQSFIESFLKTKPTNKKTPLDETSVLLLAYVFHLGGRVWPSGFCCLCKLIAECFLERSRRWADPPTLYLHECPPPVLSSSRLRNTCPMASSGLCTLLKCPIAGCASLHSRKLLRGLRKGAWDSHAALGAWAGLVRGRREKTMT